MTRWYVYITPHSLSFSFLKHKKHKSCPMRFFLLSIIVSLPNVIGGLYVYFLNLSRCFSV